MCCLVDIPAFFIKTFTRKGDLALDPFYGLPRGTCSAKFACWRRNRNPGGVPVQGMMSKRGHIRLTARTLSTKSPGRPVAWGW